MSRSEANHPNIPSIPGMTDENAGAGLPEIRWSREWGWLNAQDRDGTWFSIPAKGAPHGWVQIANQAKADARARLRLL